MELSAQELDEQLRPFQDKQEEEGDFSQPSFEELDEGQYVDLQDCHRPVDIIPAVVGYHRMLSPAKEVAEIFGCGTNVALAIMMVQSQKYTPENLIVKLLEDPGQIELFKESADKQKLVYASSTPCLLCEQVQSTQVSLGCGHLICLKCSRTYITAKFEQDNLVPRCAAEHCHNRFLPAIVTEIFGQSSAFVESIQKRVVRRWLSASKNAFQCATPACDIIFIRNDSSIESSQCPKCSQKYCWQCKSHQHRPLTCQQVQSWAAVHSELINSVTLDWMKVNTARCPSCTSSIELNGGCNKVHCICKTVFCYFCGGQVKDNSHENCKKPKPIADFVPEVVHDYDFIPDFIPEVIPDFAHVFITEATNQFTDYWNVLTKEMDMKIWSFEKNIEPFATKLNITPFEASILKNLHQRLLQAASTLKNTYLLVLFASDENYEKDIYTGYQRSCRSVFMAAMQSIASLDIVMDQLSKDAQVLLTSYRQRFSVILSEMRRQTYELEGHLNEMGHMEASLLVKI